jgi:hypothetical protein
MASETIPDSGTAGSYNVAGTAFVKDNDVPCAYEAAFDAAGITNNNDNLISFRYFKIFRNACGEISAVIKKSFLNSILSQLYCVIDKAGIKLGRDGLCSYPCALHDAIIALIDKRIGSPMLGGISPDN